MQQKTKNFRPTHQPRTTMETAYMVWSFSLPTRSAAGSRVDDDRRCRSPQLGFTTSQPRGCIPSSAPRTALREAVGQSLGLSRGQPFGRILETRTETQTALREDTRTTPREDTRTDPWAKDHKLQSLYGVAHIRCQLSGRASPSRTSSCRNPDSLTALRNSFRGRERRSQIMHGMCMRARDECGGLPLHLYL